MHWVLKTLGDPSYFPGRTGFNIICTTENAFKVGGHCNIVVYVYSWEEEGVGF